VRAREPLDHRDTAGGVISPLLAIIYLHEVLDLWFEHDVTPRMQEPAFLVRYATMPACVRQSADAERVLDVSQTSGEVRPHPASGEDQAGAVWPPQKRPGERGTTATARTFNFLGSPTTGSDAKGGRDAGVHETDTTQAWSSQIACTRRPRRTPKPGWPKLVLREWPEKVCRPALQKELAMSCRALVATFGFVVSSRWWPVRRSRPGGRSAGGRGLRARPTLQGRARQRGPAPGHVSAMGAVRAPARPELKGLYRVAIEDEYLGRRGIPPRSSGTWPSCSSPATRIATGRSCWAWRRPPVSAETSRSPQCVGVDSQAGAAATHCSGLAVWATTPARTAAFRPQQRRHGVLQAIRALRRGGRARPADGSIPVRSSTTRCRLRPSGMKRRPLLELNSGNSMGYFPDRVSVFTTLVSFLQDTRPWTSRARFQAIKPELSSIVNGADLVSAASFECSPAEARRAPGQARTDGRDQPLRRPAWVSASRRPDKRDDRDRREHSGASRCAQGPLLGGHMKEVLETTIEHGGATDAEMRSTRSSRSGDLTMWLRAPDNFEWQRIRLSACSGPAAPARPHTDRAPSGSDDAVRCLWRRDRHSGPPRRGEPDPVRALREEISRWPSGDRRDLGLHELL